jgi:hypothetical protein
MGLVPDGTGCERTLRRRSSVDKDEAGRCARSKLRRVGGIASGSEAEKSGEKCEKESVWREDL